MRRGEEGQGQWAVLQSEGMAPQLCWGWRARLAPPEFCCRGAPPRLSALTHPPRRPHPPPLPPALPGIDGFGYEDRRRVQQAFADLRLERPAARAVLEDVARK